MRSFGALLGTVLLVAGLVGASPPASAAAAPTTLTLSSPAAGKAGLPVSFTAALRDQDNAPIPGATILLQRGPGWVTATSGTTDSNGQVVLTVPRPAGSSQWRAFYHGDDVTFADATSSVVSVTGQVFASTLTVTGPTRLVDEQSARLTFTWRASDDSPVAGRLVVYRKLGTGPYTAYRTLTTSTAGTTSVVVRPRVDSRWFAVGTAGSWWLADTSPTLLVDNLPSGLPVAYPQAAPRPSYTPPQARATTTGAHVVVSRIPNNTWRSMVGRTWHRGCPVGRAGLRLLRVNYWGFDGYRYRGEIVLRAAVVYRAGRAFHDMYNRKLPIRRMYRVDRFGWSKRLRGGNDYASMRADNTSGFNCRQVVNRPGVMSPHARGRAIDINTWENPYHSATGLVQRLVGPAQPPTCRVALRVAPGRENLALTRLPVDLRESRQPARGRTSATGRGRLVHRLIDQSSSFQRGSSSHSSLRFCAFSRAFSASCSES